jgi:hypothetical protein
MSDTCTLSQLSPMSLTTVSVSPRWVIPVLYHSYHLCLYRVQVSLILVILIQYSQRQVITVIEYRYHSSWWYWYSTVRDISDYCDRVQVSFILIPVLYHSYHLCLWLYCISITKMSDTCTLSQLSPMSLTVLSVSPRWMIPVLYHSYHLCLWLYHSSWWYWYSSQRHRW